MVPKRLGGYETDIRTYIAVMAELGRGCGSTAWTASLLNVCAWLGGLFPDRAQQEVWGSNAEPWIAGSLAPRGEARPTDGGWLVNALALGVGLFACPMGGLRHSDEK
jgi:alkylation response protein AidB-like acyl-CoA dehydrogenase